MAAVQANDWNIQNRSHHCSRTGREFTDGEIFCTLLFKDGAEFLREDVSGEAWEEIRDGDIAKPFSFWRTKYHAPPPPEEEALPKENAETLFRRLAEKGDPLERNAVFVLAVMLERKRILRQVDAQETEDGRTLIYERAKTGEVFLVVDPELKLSEIEPVQTEVVLMLEESLGGGKERR